jgi:S1-C subfamily serine protease
VTLDQVNQRVRFQRQEREIPPAAPIRSIGLALAPASEGGVVIARVTDGGVAANAGLRVGDVVIEVAHRPAQAFLPSYELATLVQRGEATHVEISRGGRRISVNLTPRVLVE